MAVVLYGIKNCDSIKKARLWLTDNAVEFQFHDYRKDGLNPDLLARLESTLGWEAMINKRGTNWRQLPDETKTTINKDLALKLMTENPAIIKRPILDTGQSLELGFSNNAYQQISFYE